MGIPAKSQKRVKLSRTAEFLTAYILMKIQSHGSEDDLVKNRIREGLHDVLLPSSWAYEEHD